MKRGGIPEDSTKVILVTVLAAAGLSGALEAQESSDELAKQLSNPVADLISVPFQFNAAFGGGADDDGQWYTLNIQPVIPLSIAPDWNLIVRTIVPIMGREDIVADDTSEWGFGNTLQSFFFSPKAPTAGGLIWASVPPSITQPPPIRCSARANGAQARPRWRCFRKAR